VTEIDSLVGKILGGRYRVDGLVGRGSMSVVFRATQLSLGRQVAIKLLRPDRISDPHAIERFRREALAVARLAHPNIVTIHHFDTEAEYGTYLVMELLEGETLRDVIEKEGALSPETAVRLIRDVGSAVHAAHEAGLVHRDLKPENVFVVAEDGRQIAKVLDFGIAKLREVDGRSVDALTATGHVVGTPYYMSPEQCLGDDLDARSDVYALGCLLYELLAGRPPFVKGDAVAVMQAHVTAPPAPLKAIAPNTPTHLERAVHRALAKRVDDRFATALEFTSALDPLRDADHTTSGTRRTAPPAPGLARVSDVATRERPRPKPSNAHLPRYLTTFVGRDRAITDVTSILGEARLMTLTGPGGIGKTRLAIEVATRLAPDFKRVRTAELAVLTDPGLVTRTVATALEVPDSQHRSADTAMIDSIGAERVLLLLDNCEHLVDACAQLVARMLRACPSLHVLATSREALGVAGETVWPVMPLALPPAESPGDVTQFEAVRLFRDRALRSVPSFRLTPANATSAAAICRRLDGIPLAIELAAARVKVLSLKQILERLEDRFRLLTGGDRSSLQRHQTLRATIDWSYELLNTEERAVLARLSVFAGGWTLEGAEAVVGPMGDLGNLLDLLSRLADKSLVTVAQDEEAEPRHHLLETVRVYAAEKLAESGDEDSMRSRHAEWCVRLAFGAKNGYVGSGLAPWLARLDAEHDNIRQALAWLVVADPAAALRMCCAIGWFWNIRGHLAEGREWFSRAMRACARTQSAPDDLHAEALHEAANLAERLGALTEARSFYERSLSLRRALGDGRGAALTLHNLGVNATDRGDYDSAITLHEESAAHFREIGDESGLALALNGIAVAERYCGRFDTAYERSLESLAICRSLGAERGVGVLLFNLGSIANARGEIDEAERLLAEGLSVGRRLGERALEANALDGLAHVARTRRSFDQSAKLFAESLELRRKMGDLVGISASLAGLAQIASERDDLHRTVALGAAALALRESIGAGLGDFDEVALRELIQRSRDRLGTAGDLAYTEGRTMSVEAAISYGFETTSEGLDV
jgi:predicted ATPase/serine/threonine protein kinase